MAIILIKYPSNHAQQQSNIIKTTRGAFSVSYLVRYNSLKKNYDKERDNNNKK